MRERYDVLAIGAHPDDVEVFMGGTVAKPTDRGLSVLLVEAEQIRIHRPRMVFTSGGCGVHPDHKAVTDIVTNAVIYARLPKWDEVPGGERLGATEPHEIERLFFGHCRMESAWESFDFAVGVTATHERKLAALAAYESVFSGDQAELLERYGAEDRYGQPAGGALRRGVQGAQPAAGRRPDRVRPGPVRIARASEEGIREARVTGPPPAWAGTARLRTSRRRSNPPDGGGGPPRSRGTRRRTGTRRPASGLRTARRSGDSERSSAGADPRRGREARSSS